jgi:hypothetical protein
LLCTGDQRHECLVWFWKTSRFDWRSARWKCCNTQGLFTNKGVTFVLNRLFPIMLVRGSHGVLVTFQLVQYLARKPDTFVTWQRWQICQLFLSWNETFIFISRSLMQKVNSF